MMRGGVAAVFLSQLLGGNSRLAAFKLWNSTFLRFN
jgi:hypothetical protein